MPFKGLAVALGRLARTWAKIGPNPSEHRPNGPNPIRALTGPLKYRPTLGQDRNQMQKDATYSAIFYK